MRPGAIRAFFFGATYVYLWNLTFMRPLGENGRKAGSSAELGMTIPSKLSKNTQFGILRLLYAGGVSVGNASGCEGVPLKDGKMYYPEAYLRDALRLMELPAQTTVRVSAKLDHLPEIVGSVEAFAEARELKMGDVFAVTLAVEELFANTINHSHPPAVWVEVELAMNEGGVHVTYRDDAPGSFDPTKQAAPDTTLGVEERQIGGLGIHVIRKTMRDFRYERVGEWNVVRFTRVLT